MSGFRVKTDRAEVGTKRLRHVLEMQSHSQRVACPVDECATLCDSLWRVGHDLDFSLEVGEPFGSFAYNAVQYVVYLGRPERRSTAARLLYFLTHEPSFLALVQHLTYLSLARSRHSGKFVFSGRWNSFSESDQRRRSLQEVAKTFPKLFDSLVDLLGWVMKYPVLAQAELSARLNASKVA